MEKHNYITIITRNNKTGTNQALGLDRINDFIESNIDTKSLSKNLTEFLNNFTPVIDSISKKIGEFSVDEIELHLSVSAEGGIKLVGEFTAGVEAGISIKFTRHK